MTLKGKRENQKETTTPPLGEVIKQAREKVIAGLRPVLDRVKPYWLALPKPHRIGVSALAVLLVLLLLWPSSEPSQQPTVNLDGQRVAVPLNLDEPRSTENSNNTASEDTDFDRTSTPVVAPQTIDTDWVNYEVARGDTLSNIFRTQNLPLKDLYAISAIEGDDKPLSQIQPGQLLRFKRDTQGDLDIIQIESAGVQSVIFFRLSDGSFARRK
ncbi:LysM-like peptidoglycan-binding domain-containing protein [Enterovibrio calviensis]|uniref:LysM-like peptidoglycan-binding domain-containing protein n=1 Tax=Enterovibrio calviensis TaxID=91359 RepID=UPI0004819819|nr:LysM-like peptidoglycan-binding domain-containing protein [Enterovibrio calviensis]